MPSPTFVPPPTFTPPTAAPGATAPVPAAPSGTASYVPQKIRFPKWLHVADALLAVAAVGLGFVLYRAYTEQLDLDKKLEAQERAVLAQINREEEPIESEDPLPGKRFLIFRNSRNELMAAIVDAPDDAVVTWNKGITIDKRDSECAQFQMKKDGTWKSLGNFGHITEYAKEIIAGNTAVVDKNGETVFEPTMCYHNHFYQLFTKSAPWSVAKSACESNGGTLATIAGKNEQAFVSQIVGSSYVWIGGTADPRKPAKWTWGDADEPMDYTAWADGEPAEGNRMVLTDGMWIAEDESAISVDGYLCEWDVNQLTAQFEQLASGKSTKK